jgi:drug/metabolite transporter (DMT)-like permease
LVPGLSLTAVTAVWGSSFFMIKGLMRVMSPLDFLGMRFFAAGLIAMALLGWRVRRAAQAERSTRFAEEARLRQAGLPVPRHRRWVPPRVWRHGAIAGLIYGTAQIFQTTGLAKTSASVGGFITGMYVVLTPFCVWALYRRRVRALTWIGVVLAAGGLATLSLRGWHFGSGETLCLVGALLYAIHIAVLGRFSKDDDPLALAAVQLLTIGILCGIAALPGGVAWPRTPMQWAQVVYLVLFAAILALVVQTWAQSRIPPAEAAVIMTTEPVFSAVFACLFGGESVTVRLVVGGALVLSAMFLTQLLPERGEPDPPGPDGPDGPDRPAESAG